MGQKSRRKANIPASSETSVVQQSAIREAVAVRVSPVWKELRELWLKGKVADDE